MTYYELRIDPDAEYTGDGPITCKTMEDALGMEHMCESIARIGVGLCVEEVNEMASDSIQNEWILNYVVTNTAAISKIFIINWEH